ncbi:MAG: efflux RND transporter periplasmic adaptor subunit, partial [Cytophagales bacterium]|nr:efflux RND transporter periplasmic adaptor subunit [Cytophagales bacterium]
FSLLFLGFLFFECSQKSEVEVKKQELKEKKKALNDIREEITALEKELDDLDANWRGESVSQVLVKARKMKPQRFEHKIDVRASVKSRQHIDVLSETSGRVQEVLVTEGQKVREGEQLLLVDSEQLRFAIKEAGKALELARKIYDKRSALWKQNIGSEIEYLRAKNDFETLDARHKQLLTQLKFARVAAPFSGTVDQLYVNKGQVVQPSVPMIRLVDNKDLYLEADIADGYVGRFRAGDGVLVNFPTIGESFRTKITSVGRVIDPVNRTFILEARIPSSSYHLQPNLLAMVQLTDLAVRSAMVLPTKVLQRDNKGVYVYVIEEKDGQPVAEKRHVLAKSNYKGATYVSKGLNPGERVIVDGYRQVAPGTVVKIIQ